MEKVQNDVEVKGSIIMKGERLYDFPEEYLELLGPDWEPDPNSLYDVVEQIKKQSKILSGKEEEKESQEFSDGEK